MVGKYMSCGCPVNNTLVALPTRTSSILHAHKRRCTPALEHVGLGPRALPYAAPSPQVDLNGELKVLNQGLNNAESGDTAALAITGFHDACYWPSIERISRWGSIQA